MLSVLVILPLHSLAQHIKTILLRYPERFRIVGTADNSVLGMSMIESSRPDVVIMPVYMSFWNAEDLINYLLPRGAAPAFVLLEEEAEAFPPGTAAAQVAAVLPTHVPTERQLLKALDKVDALQERRKASLAQAPPHLQNAEEGLSSLQFTSVSDAFSAFQALFLNLFSQMGDPHGGTNQIVAGACSYINQNLSEPLNLESVARRVHVSPTYLSRLFKQETGSLFNTYVNQRRVLRAAQLLETHYKITDIAGMVGFGNAKYFSQVFRRYTGKTPWQYRQELREEGTS